MVSSKFHIVGEAGQWLRIRIHEEIYSHGLDGSVLQADENTLAVILEGDKAKIKRLYADIGLFMPEETELTELLFSLQKGPRMTRIRTGETLSPDKDLLMQYLSEIERKTTRIDQKLTRIVAMLEAGRLPERDDDDDEPPTFPDSDMEVEEEATSGFAAMFG